MEYSSADLDKLGGQAFFSHARHSLGENVHFAEGGVNVGRDAKALELRMFDRSSDDPILVEQIAGQLRRINTLDVDQGQSARLFRVVTGQYLDALLTFERLRPTVEEETQAGGLAIGADAFVKI